MARKLNKNLVALGSAAIVTVYGIGLARTHSAASGPAAVSPAIDASTAIAQALASATPTASGLVRELVTATPAAPGVTRATVTATPTLTTAPAVYHDGVFTGSGTSRFGGFEVAVTIQGGRITGVELTRVTTRYPASRIARLPAQVVERQSADVDMVTGATASARAFREAVAQALAQAVETPSRG